LSTGHKISLLDIEYDGEDGEILRYKFGCVYCQACYYKGVNNLTEPEKVIIGTDVTYPIQKFRAGDRVRILAELPSYMRYFVKDKDATVLYSFDDKHGKGNQWNKPLYALDIDNVGYCAWYPECVLTSLPEKRVIG